MECMNKMLSKSRMRQGESFPLRFYIYTKADKATGTPSKAIVGEYASGQTIDTAIIPENIAIQVGTLRKTWENKAVGPKDDEVWYNPAPSACCWNFPISQEESLAMSPGEYKGQIKVLFNSDQALICEIDSLLIVEALDKEVL